jgi:hypothetical protein
MSKRTAIIAWSFLLLLTPACVGPGKRPAKTPPPAAKASVVAQKGYAPTYRHPWALANGVANNAAKDEKAIASSERYQFTRPPVEEEEVKVTATPKEMPIRMVESDPEEKIVSEKKAIEPVEAQAKIVTTAPPKPIAKSVPLEKKEIETGNETTTRLDVIAPEWPTINPVQTPVRTPALTVKMPRPEIQKTPTIELDPIPQNEVNAPPYPSISPVTPGLEPPAPMIQPAVRETPNPKSPEIDQRATIREIVRETLKELPVPPVKNEPETKAIPQPAPTGKESPLVLAIRAYQAKDLDGARTHLKQYDATNQELLLSLMPLLVRLGEGSVGTMSPDELASHLDQLRTASSALQSRAALKAETVCFCKRVLKFGKYDAIEPEHIYAPGEPVEVYFELRNFTWQQGTGENGSHAMRLGSALEVRDSQQRVVWRRDLTTTDSRQSPPSDYYLVYRFALPELPPGAYTLDVQVVDQLDQLRRHTRRSLELRVGSKP